MSKSRKDNIDVNKLIDRAADQEQKFLSSRFIAPALSGGVVRVKIGEAVCRIKTAPEDFEGYGIFEPISITEAILVREASLAERRKYLELFPRVRLIACRRTAAGWFACSANRGDARFQIDGLVPIRIASDVQQFDTLIARFDGAQFWFDELDIRANPTQARDLRESLEQRALPEDVKSSGLSAEQRAAFELCYWLSAAGRQNRRSRAPTQRNIEIEQSINYGDPVRSRLTDSLSHAGARLVSYVERNDSYQISYEVNGQNYTSAIDKDNMTVFSAGICLAGEDEKFDLTSLVGVLREGQRTGQIYDD